MIVIIVIIVMITVAVVLISVAGGLSEIFCSASEFACVPR